jgi:hypothetical protein
MFARKSKRDRTLALHLDEGVAGHSHELRQGRRPEFPLLDGRVFQEQHLVLVLDAHHVQMLAVIALLPSVQQPLLPGPQPGHRRQHHLQVTCIISEIAAY